MSPDNEDRLLRVIDQMVDQLQKTAEVLLDMASRIQALEEASRVSR